MHAAPASANAAMRTRRARRLVARPASTFTWAETARIATTKKIVHGVAFSPDSRYAYISQESIGADPGAIDVIDLTTRQKMFTIPVPAQPTGIVVWRRPN